MAIAPRDALRNRLLARLTRSDFDRLLPHSLYVPLELEQPIYDQLRTISYFVLSRAKSLGGGG
jgi:hypothetical protein